MDSERWERIQALFHEALDLPVPERAACLAKGSGGDEQLVAEVRALLDEDARGASLLDRDVSQVASQMLGPPLSLAAQDFGPYRLQQTLGEGGMGVVYLAKREDLGSVAAIKVLRDAWMSPARRERFATEQRTLAQMTHPSIARLYDADTLADGTPWFAMEYVKGIPLAEYCVQHQRQAGERLKTFREVCEAVQYAHSRAVIHRDLKSSNILVQSDGSIKLLDFGIAKQLDQRDRQADRTRTGLRLMTPAYAAPEQIRGEQAGLYTDVYALGVILYELLAGALPFDVENATTGAIERMILEQEPEKPSARANRQETGGRAAQAAKRAWADLDVLCLTAMHKQPERRYGSVEALIRDIDHYLKAEPLDARPDSLQYRTGKFMRRHRRSVLAAASVLVIVIGLVTFFTLRLASTRNAALAEAARAQRIQRFMLNLFSGGDQEAGPAENLRVLDLLDRGVQQARLLDREPAAQADLYHTLGGIYATLGKLDQADSLLGAALKQRESMSGGQSPGTAESEVELGLLRSEQNKLDEAERMVRDGLAKARRQRPPDNSLVAQALLSLGQVLERRGKFTEAIAVLEEAVKLRSGPGPPTAELADTLNELANNQYQMGRYDAARSLHQRALGLHKQLLGERHPAVAGDLLDLADIEQELGYYPEAERLIREALAIVRPYYGENHPETAHTLTTLGRTLVFEKRYDEAKVPLEQALAIRERVYGKVHPTVAETLNELGSLAYQRDQLDEAEKLFQRMADIYQAVYHGHYFGMATAESNIGAIYMDRKQWPRAEQYFRQALPLYIETQGPEHINIGIVEEKLGHSILRQFRYRDAEPHLLTSYRILSKQASPDASWLQWARKDLAAIYTALGQPEKARKFLAEREAVAGAGAAHRKK